MKDYQFLSLFFVIFLGVMLGNLASTFVTAQVAAYQLNQAAKQLRLAAEHEQNIRNIEADKAKAILKELRQKDRAQLVDERSKSKKGREMLRSCRDWRAQFESTPNEYTRKEADRQCELYSKYLQTGR